MFKFLIKTLLVTLILLTFTSYAADISDSYFEAIKQNHNQYLPPKDLGRFRYLRLGDKFENSRELHYFLVIQGEDLFRKETCRHISTYFANDSENVSLLIDTTRDGEFVNEHGQMTLDKVDIPEEVTSIRITNISRNVTSVILLQSNEPTPRSLKVWFTPQLAAIYETSLPSAGDKTNNDSTSSDNKQPKKGPKEKIDDSDFDDDDDALAPQSPARAKVSEQPALQKEIESIVASFQAARDELTDALSDLQQIIDEFSRQLDAINAELDDINPDSLAFSEAIARYSQQLDELLDVLETLINDAAQKKEDLSNLIAKHEKTPGIELDIYKAIATSSQDELDNAERDLEDLTHDKMATCGELNADSNDGDIS